MTNSRAPRKIDRIAPSDRQEGARSPAPMMAFDRYMQSLSKQDDLPGNMRDRWQNRAPLKLTGSVRIKR